MGTRKVVGILTKPRDWQWSEEEMRLSWDVFRLGPPDYFAMAGPREFLILAACWREQASVSLEHAEKRLRAARSFEYLATGQWREQTRMYWGRY